MTEGGMDDTRTVDEELRAIALGILDQAKRETDAGVAPTRILALGMAAGAIMRVRDDWEAIHGPLTRLPKMQADA
jgi:hypothetical protein